MIARDPNWLYSTTAQSTAALVAIIGGFLVSRVLNLANRREGLEARLREVTSEIDLAAPGLNELAAENLALDVKYFIEGAQGAIVDYVWGGRDLGGLTAELLVAEGADDRERDPGVFDPYLLPIVEEAGRAMERIRAVPPYAWPSTAAEMRSTNFDIDEELEWLWDGLLDRRSLDKPRPPFGGLVPDYSGLTGLIPRIPAAAYGRGGPTRWDQEKTLSAAMAQLTARRTLIENELADAAATAGLAEPIGVLAFFSVVGMVFPMVLLAMDPVPTGPWARGLVVGGFLLGLGALLRYLLAEAKRVSAHGRPT